MQNKKTEAHEPPKSLEVVEQNLLEELSVVGQEVGLLAR